MLRKILLLALIVLMGCIDPIGFKFDNEQEYLVVEGNFSNEPGINYLRLTYAQPYSHPFPVFEDLANVIITGNNGERYRFINDKNGYYYPEVPELTYGTIGNTYVLTINAKGKTYQSEPITLQQPIPVKKVHFEVDEQNYAYRGDKDKKIHPGLKIMVDYDDPGEVRNFYRWSFSSVYEVNTQPQDYVEYGCRTCPRPAPKRCCSTCWVKENNEAFSIANDRLNNGGKVINQEVLFIPFNQYLQKKHKLKVYQHVVTEDAYNFFRMMEKQKGSTGTVFDPPPSEIKGNMFNIADKEEQVIGLFNVSTVSVKEIIIEPNLIDYPITNFIFPDDCQVIPGATTVRPDNW